MDMNRAEDGDMSEYFTDYTNDINERILEKSMTQSSPRIGLKEEEKQALIAYPGAIHCK